MGFVAIPSLLDHDPATSNLPARPVGDHIPGWGATGITARRTAAGVRFAARGFTLDANTNGTEWTAVSAFIEAPTKSEVESFNKILRGTGFPRIETDWRTKQVILRIPGNRISLPVLAEVALAGGMVDGSVAVTRLAGATAATATIVAPAKAALAPKPVTAPIRATSAAIADRLAPPPSLVVRAPVSPVKPEPVAAPIKAAPLAPTSDPTGVFTWPTKSSGIWTEPHVQPELDMLWAMHMAGDRQVIGLKGPAGTGKTSLAFDLAVRHGVPVAKIDCAGAITFADWVGATGATERNGATVTEFQPSGFLQAVRADGPMAGIPRIVLLDEINRSESSAANNALIPCLDHTGSLYVADARRAIPLDPAVMFVLTANMGASYTGTVALDQALVDRVTHWEPMGYPKHDIEVSIVVDRTGLDVQVATALVRAAAAVRDVATRGEIAEGIGPRRVLVAARKIKQGFSPVRACISTWALSYSEEGGSGSERATVQSRIEAAFR